MNQFYVNAYIERNPSLKFGMNFMKFSRKLVVRMGTYGTISVPKPIFDAWASVETVEMQFDERGNVLVIKPITGDSA